MDGEWVVKLVECVLTGCAGVVGVVLGRRSVRAKVEPERGEPPALPVDVRDKYVTRAEFDKHAQDNARDHENLFGRLNRNDRETSEIKGMLAGIRDDLSAIKNKLFRTTTRS